ncbi:MULTISPECIES: aminoglycoside 6-adenylyltransferase [Bacillus]|uniref:aminoglycoside 6-adenylyltransferase n=1 Tax=Bacillus TaxID=1386 RepID=UPI0002DEC7A1|nr:MULTISPECIES: aminoglycoside 6-adenylyltransferase [Bacillus]
MRSSKEIISLVLQVAKEDHRIRAVAMNGSRTNQRAPKDPFQDYDIVYLVTDMQTFINHPSWINVFGERIMMQTPENMFLFPPSLGGRFTYLMLFEDGNRIDLMLVPIEEKEAYYKEDSLTILLLDKDDPSKSIPEPTDKGYWVKKPTLSFYLDCWNEFWWLSTYVAKGLWRKEVLYALDYMHHVRSMLLTMLEWKVGIDTDFSVSIGKSGKYLKQFVDKDIWEKYLRTFSESNDDAIWNALFEMIELFQDTALYVSKELQFIYPLNEAEKVKSYLHHIHKLPEDAFEIYE